MTVIVVGNGIDELGLILEQDGLGPTLLKKKK